MNGNNEQRSPMQLMPEEWQELAREIEALEERTADLAKGIARGIVEAPVGHIGLLHYAKDIPKPQQRESEPDADYELRVRTNRMNGLTEKIRNDTTGRVLRIKELLGKIGLPAAGAG